MQSARSVVATSPRRRRFGCSTCTSHDAQCGSPADSHPGAGGGRFSRPARTVGRAATTCCSASSGVCSIGSCGKIACRASPVRTKPRRQTARRIPCLLDPAEARRLLDVAGNLPDRPRAPLRGPTYRTIFALLYGLGLRVGEVSRLRCADVDFLADRRLLMVRDTKFGKSRLVPFGPRIGTLLHAYLRLQWRQTSSRRTMPLVHGAGSGSSGHHQPDASHHLVPRLGLSIPPGVAPPRVHRSAPRVRGGHLCSAGITWRASIPPHACSTSRPSSGTSTPPLPRST